MSLPRKCRCGDIPDSCQCEPPAVIVGRPNRRFTSVLPTSRVRIPVSLVRRGPCAARGIPR